MRIRAIVLSLASLAAAPVLAWDEPSRGSVTRAALMDAIRPHAHWMLGAPVEFVVDELRQDGDLAFAMLRAQRPGGARIDVRDTPAFARGEVDSHSPGDLTEIQVLYVKSGDTWVAVHHAFGATDAWWAWGPLCAEFKAITPRACDGVD